MKKSKFFVVVGSLMVIFQLFIHCESRNKEESFHEKIQGHWHMRSPYPITLDIKDSLIKFNQYSFTENTYDFSLYDSVDGLPNFPIPCGCGGSILPVVKNFELTNDSLIYTDTVVITCSAYTPIKFVRSDLERCKWTHLFGDWSSLVRLDNFTAASAPLIELDSLGYKNAVAAIVIGYPVEQEQFGKDPVILVHDVFIAATDIPLFLEKEKERDGRGYPLVVCLIVDESVPADFVKEVIASMPERVVDKIFRVFSSTGDIKIGGQEIKVTR